MKLKVVKPVGKLLQSSDGKIARTYSGNFTCIKDILKNHLRLDVGNERYKVKVTLISSFGSFGP